MARLLTLLEKLNRLSPSLAWRALQISNNAVRTDETFLSLYWSLVRDSTMLLTLREAYNIYRYVNATAPLGGALAELGVFKGGGARLLCAAKHNDPLHLFDTFEGMPETDASVDLHRKGDFSDTSEDAVKQYLADYPEVHSHKGWFPDSARRDLPDDIQFRFVHLDVDIYESTLAGLEYFYPRLKKGGVLISHDYNALSCPGVKKAFDAYFSGTDVDVVPLWDSQCMVRKTASD